MWCLDVLSGNRCDQLFSIFFNAEYFWCCKVAGKTNPFAYSVTVGMFFFSGTVNIVFEVSNHQTIGEKRMFQSAQVQHLATLGHPLGTAAAAANRSCSRGRREGLVLAEEGKARLRPSQALLAATFSWR